MHTPFTFIAGNFSLGKDNDCAERHRIFFKDKGMGNVSTGLLWSRYPLFTLFTADMCNVHLQQMCTVAVNLLCMSTNVLFLSGTSISANMGYEMR